MRLGGSSECGQSIGDVVGYATTKMTSHYQEWTRRLAKDPSSFNQIEHEVLDFFRLLAGFFMIALLSDVVVRQGIESAGKGLRSGVKNVLRYVRKEFLQVTLLCGLTIWIQTSYWLPVRTVGPGRRRGIGKRGKEGTGLYPELAVLGIREGLSSALQEEIARLAVIMPSFELALQELAKRGICLDLKTVVRAVIEAGEQALSARKVDMDAWRRGELQPGTELHGQKVVVSVDGGRIRVRKLHTGRRTKKKRHRFETPWKEPKLLRIYTVDSSGRRDPDGPQVIDATMQGPDHVMELVAYHLYRLGAHHAAEVLFLADGAEWIWDRVPMIAKQIGFGQWLAGNDFCHTFGYILCAINAVGMSDKERKNTSNLCRLALRNGKTAKVIECLRNLPDSSCRDEVQKAIRYIEARTELLKYDVLLAKGLPIGSGAVESAIRRVVNLRVKGPGMFWKEDNAEGMLHLRAALLSGQWGGVFRRIDHYSRTSREVDWKWASTPYSCKAKENENEQLVQLVKRVAA